MRVVAIASGGMDSVTLLYWLRAKGHEVHALGFDYGQRHSKELVSLVRICHREGFPVEVADIKKIGPLIAGKSSQLNEDIAVPHGHYADENMKTTVVPNRNMIMLSIAIGHAISLDGDAVAYGAHAGDHAIYPDCRESFASAMDEAARVCDWKRIEILRPFVDWGKHDIAKVGEELKVPYELTWSCYEGKERHCGKCGTCVERKEAFELARMTDPTQYAA